MSRSITTKWAGVAEFIAALSAPAGAADLAAMPQRYVPVTTGPAFTSADMPAVRSAEKMQATRQSERR